MKFIAFLAIFTASMALSSTLPALMNSTFDAEFANSQCDFYSRDLENQFPCGPKGFMLQYATPRCEGAMHFSGSDDFQNWLRNISEPCIRERLQILITQQFATLDANNWTCQEFEQKATIEINRCYEKVDCSDEFNDPALCVLLHDTDSEREDLTNLASAFNVGGEYYINIVDSGIPEVVRHCGKENLANSLYVGRPTLRHIFCVFAILLKGSNRQITLDHYINYVQEHLKDKRSNFVYGGTNMHEKCLNAIASGTQYSPGDEHQFHVVTWFADANNTFARTYYNDSAIVGSDGHVFSGYYEYTTDIVLRYDNTIRDHSKCGNGRRDSGELCDYAMRDSQGCTFHCDFEPAM